MRNKEIWTKTLSIALALVLVGSRRGGTEQSAHPAPVTGDVAQGVISIGISGNGLRQDYYWQYEINLSTGKVRIVKEDRYKPGSQKDVPDTSQKLTGHKTSCSGHSGPGLASWDGGFLAQCSSPSRPDKEDFVVIDAKTSSTLYHWTHKKWRGISEFTWAPNSHSIAILNNSEYYGKTPPELLTGLSGHPIPHDTVYLDIIDARTGNVTEILVRKNVLYASSSILNWSE